MNGTEAWGCQGAAGGQTAHSGETSSSTMASSAAAMPSAIEWCSFSIKAIRPLSRPSTKVSSHKGGPGVRGVETTSAHSLRKLCLSARC